MSTPTYFNLSEAKPHLGKLVRKAQLGEEIGLSAYDIPAVVLVPVSLYSVIMEAFHRDRRRNARLEPSDDDR